LSHYPTLKAQLAEDIATSQTYVTAQFVKFGRPLKPISDVSHAIVNTAVSRENVGRHVVEQWTFNIALRVLKSAVPADQDSETFLMANAWALIDLLAPYDLTSPPTPAGLYAGVGDRRRVTSIDPTDGQEQDADKFHTIVIEFVTFTKTYQ
jgi:hypothetical protein